MCVCVCERERERETEKKAMPFLPLQTRMHKDALSSETLVKVWGRHRNAYMPFMCQNVQRVLKYSRAAERESGQNMNCACDCLQVATY